MSARVVWVSAIVAAPVLTFLLVNDVTHLVLAVTAVVFMCLVVRSPHTATVLLVPVSLLSTVFAGQLVVVAAVAAVTLLVGARVLAGVLPLRPPHLWIGLLALLTLVSFAFPAVTSAQSPAARFADLVGLLTGLALLAVATATPPDPGRLARIIALAWTFAAGYVLVAGDRASGRLEGLGLNPNFLGAVLALPLVAATGLVGRGRRLAWLAPAAICLVAIAGTQSRGAFYAATIGVAAVLIQGRPPRLQALIVAVIMATVMVLPGGLSVVERVAAGNRESAELSYDSAVRRQVAQFATQVAVEHPLRGIGLGMFPSYAASAPRFGLYMVTHNDYLRLAAEAGALTLGAFLVLLGLALRGRRSGGPAVLRAVVLTYAVGLLFANPLASVVVSVPFWLSLGCLLSTSQAARSRPCGRPASGMIRSFRHREGR